MTQGTQPEVLARLGSPGTSQSIALDHTNQHLYVADGPAGISVIDISDPSQPEEIDVIRTEGDAKHVEIDAERGQLLVFAEDVIVIYDLETGRRLGGQSFEAGCCGPEFALSDNGRWLYLNAGIGIRHFERRADGAGLIDRGLTETSSWVRDVLTGPDGMLIGLSRDGGLIQMEEFAAGE